MSRENNNSQTWAREMQTKVDELKQGETLKPNPFDYPFPLGLHVMPRKKVRQIDMCLYLAKMQRRQHGHSD